MAKKKRETAKQRRVRLRKWWGIDKLDRKSLELLRHTLEHPEMKIPDLAAIVGIHRTRASVLMNQPAFKNAIAEANLGALEKLESLRRKSIDRIEALMDQDEDPNVALRAALFVAGPVQPDTSATDEARNFADFLVKAHAHWEARELERLAKEEAETLTTQLEGAT